jgi:hypothetical protein
MPSLLVRCWLLVLFTGGASETADEEMWGFFVELEEPAEKPQEVVHLPPGQAVVDVRQVGRLMLTWLGSWLNCGGY